MLIKCPECGKENISNEATTCPTCGYPIKPTTIEKTGKKWKSVQLISALVCIIGIVVLIAGQFTVAIILLFFGLMIFIGARIGGWWHHG